MSTMRGDAPKADIVKGLHEFATIDLLQKGTRGGGSKKQNYLLMDGLKP